MSKKFLTAVDLKGKTQKELSGLVKEYRSFLTGLKIKHSLGQLKETHTLSQIKKTLARIKFFMNNQAQ